MIHIHVTYCSSSNGRLHNSVNDKNNNQMQGIKYADFSHLNNLYVIVSGDIVPLKLFCYLFDGKHPVRYGTSRNL